MFVRFVCSSFVRFFLCLVVLALRNVLVGVYLRKHSYFDHILQESSNAYSIQFTTKLSYIKRIQYSAVKQNFNIIHTMCEIFRTIPLVLRKIQLIQFRKSQNWNLGSSLQFHLSS